MSDLRFPMLLKYGDNHVYTVKGYIEDGMNYEEGKGYVLTKDSKIYNTTKAKDEIVLIFTNSPTRIQNRHDPIIPMFTSSASFSYAEIDKESYKYFGIKNLVDLSVMTIIEDSIKIVELYNEEELNDLNASSDAYIPVINDSDDFLKKLIKKAIIEKGINIKVLQGRFHDKTKWTLSNIKTALIGDTKMSVERFAMWVELLGLDFTIAIEDNGLDRVTPLEHPIIYSSMKNSLEVEK